MSINEYRIATIDDFVGRELERHRQRARDSAQAKRLVARVGARTGRALSARTVGADHGGREKLERG
ncbi:hypothetical protein PQR64_10345 [Paraburkholderia phytofirmans]|uniref:hypothetical protein n=1 Tax=Paraburkholderia phytofirmans TaxID=261302 RepID=UPI0038BC2512